MRFSIVIPTFQRRDIVVRNVLALERQAHRDFEVIVVVDGSTDGTGEALQGQSVTFPLLVVESANQGRASAVNLGAAQAIGELLLFLDDDMEAEPSLLVEHERSHREGADLVLGDLPLRPDSPANLLSWGAGFWASTRRERLTAPGAEIGLSDLLTGQMSISRDMFERLGRFDTSFTRDGLFGGEDIDFGYRALSAGLRIVFNPNAISYQYYDVDPSAYLRRAYEAGRAEQELIAKHPERARQLAEGPRFRSRRSRLFFGPFLVAPRAVSWPLRAGSAALVRSGVRTSWLRRLFWGARTMEHLRGARAARRALSTGRVVVLAYHAIADLHDDPVLEPYGVPPARFVEQLDRLSRHGWTFVDLDAVLAALAGREHLRPRSLLLTFDDAYADLLEAAGLLARKQIPAVVFAVSERIGGTNEWDRPIGARTLELLDASGLRAVAEQHIEIGSHGASHRPFPSVSPHELESELADSSARLESLGLPRPRALAYPHGEWTAEVADAVFRAGYSAAFTVEPGVVEFGADLYGLPRIEVLAGDSPRELELKIRTAGWPSWLRRRLLRLLRVRQ